MAVDRMVSWAQMEILCEALCRKLIKSIPAYKLRNKKLIAISRGGCIPATLVSHMLHLPITRTLHIATYGDDRTRKLGAQIHNLQGIGVEEIQESIFVDDILDSGLTINTVQGLYGKAKFIVPVAKPKGMAACRDHLLIFPELTVSDNVWIHFPWEKKRIV